MGQLCLVVPGTPSFSGVRVQEGLGWGAHPPWGAVHTLPGQSKNESMLAYTRSPGTPSGTDPAFLSGHFLLHSGLHHGARQGNQSLSVPSTLPSLRVLCVKAQCVTGSLGIKVLESEDKPEFQLWLCLLRDLGRGASTRVGLLFSVCPSAGGRR